MIETHCHLDYLKQLPLPKIIEKSKQEGVNKIITISVSPENLDIVQEISNSNEHVFCTQGIHPHDAKDFTSEVEEKIKNNLSHKKTVAIGEIGLDYHYDNSPREIQKDAFKKQLQIACDADLPVVIHTREAETDTQNILKEFTHSLKKRGVLHSFTSSWELANYALKAGFFLGFNGIITFKNASELREIVQKTPLSQILIETDSPFLTPVPHRGKENAPFYLKFIAEKIAEIKNTSVQQVIETTIENSYNLFHCLT